MKPIAWAIKERIADDDEDTDPWAGIYCNPDTAKDDADALESTCTSRFDVVPLYGPEVFERMVRAEAELAAIKSQPVPGENIHQNMCVGFVRARAANGNKEDASVANYIDALQSALQVAQEELADIRDALAGQDYASLPSDFPTVRMAHTIRADHDKFMQQVRYTCERAEKAEADNAKLKLDLHTAVSQGIELEAENKKLMADLDAEEGKHADTIAQAKFELSRLEAENAALRKVFDVAEKLNFESEEYDFDDGMGRGAPQGLWDDLDKAIDAAKEKK